MSPGTSYKDWYLKYKHYTNGIDDVSLKNHDLGFYDNKKMSLFTVTIQKVLYLSQCN